MTHKEYKLTIENKLNNMKNDSLWDQICEYQKLAPMDMDLITYKCLYYLYNNELEQSLKYALQGVHRYPTNGDMYYNLAYIYEQKNDLLEACRNYTKAEYIYEYTHDKKCDALHINDKIDELWNRIDVLVSEAKIHGDYSYINNVQSCMEGFKTFFGLNDGAYRSCEQIIGNYRLINNNEKKYVGLYRFDITDMVGDNNWDLIHNKGEFLSVCEGEQYIVNGNAAEYLLPIAVKEDNTTHHFLQKNNKYLILQRQSRHFNYYRVQQGTQIASGGISYYGNPVPLNHHPERKKLVLNIFVDGLSQEIINGNNFGKIMPYTYEFFSKGIVCNNAYTTAEWTYPSLANIVTGLDTPHHMMFHNIIDGSLPEDIPTIAEYFKSEGYYTAHLTGNWRIIPPYGHCRGYDRYLYQHPTGGSKAEIMIADTIEQLEGFKDTDQFVTICIEDLHDIADGLDLPIAVQNNLTLEERIVELNDNTSVKQGASANKAAAYRKMASHIDTLLNILYSYMNDNYSDDELIVSLFADHGQGYLIPDGGRFLSKERAKVAFMFRGGLKPEITNEIISAGDYISIMCKLAGITMNKNAETMTNLPLCFGGEKERDYALMESIHPGDPYRAAFFTKNYTAHFENGMPTGEDGRFEIKDYTLELENVEGNIFEDRKLYDYYLDIIMDHIAPLIVY